MSALFPRVLSCSPHSVKVSVCDFFFQAEDGIRDLVRSRGLGDVYKRQLRDRLEDRGVAVGPLMPAIGAIVGVDAVPALGVAGDACLLYTSDAADDLLCVDLGGRRIIKKKNIHNNNRGNTIYQIVRYYQLTARGQHKPLTVNTQCSR